VLPKVS